jgi:hypothetical protein
MTIFSEHFAAGLGNGSSHDTREAAMNSGFTTIGLLLSSSAGEISNKERIEAAVMYRAASAI